MLVSGWLKTSRWALAAFQDQEQSHEISFDASAASFINASLQVSLANDSGRPGPHQRRGPYMPDQHTNSSSPRDPDQCMFLQYYKMKTRRLHAPEIVNQDNVVVHEELPAVDDTNSPTTSPPARNGFFTRLYRRITGKHGQTQHADVASPTTESAPSGTHGTCSIEEVPDLSRVRFIPTLREVHELTTTSPQFSDPLDHLLDYMLDVSRLMLCDDIRLRRMLEIPCSSGYCEPR